MKPVTSVYLFENDEKFFGTGPCRLLRAIDETGSLRAAAASMDLSYSKAISMIHRAEEALQFPLTEKIIGGKGGGGSKLTDEAKSFIKKYEEYREACDEANRKIYREFFE